MGLVARKPVFGVSDKARPKQYIEISLVISLDMVLSKKRITKALIRLRGYQGWSAPLLFANLRRQVFLRRGPYNDISINNALTDIKLRTEAMAFVLVINFNPFPARDNLFHLLFCLVLLLGSLYCKQYDPDLEGSYCLISWKKF